MAFTVTERGSAHGSFVASLAAGDTFTPTAGEILVVAARANAGTSFTSITGWANTTFSEVSVSGNLHVWAAIVGSTPGSGQASLTVPASSVLEVVVIQIAGSTATTVAEAFRQTVAINTYNPSSPLSFPALSAFAVSTNLSLNFGGHGFTTGNFTAQSGFTLAIDAIADDASPVNGVAAFYKVSEETAQTLNGTFFLFKTIEGLAFEVADSDASGVAITTPPTEILRGESFTVTGTGFLSPQGTGSAVAGGITATITAWSDTSISGYLPASSNLLYTEAGVSLVITASDTSSDTAASIPWRPETGRSYLTLVSPVFSTVNYMLYGFEGTPDPVSTDQLEYDTTTVESSIANNPETDSEWVLASMPTVTQTSTCQIIRAATSVRSASWVITWPVGSGSTGSSSLSLGSGLGLGMGM